MMPAMTMMPSFCRRRHAALDGVERVGFVHGAQVLGRSVLDAQKDGDKARLDHLFGNIRAMGKADGAGLRGEHQVLQFEADDAIAQLLEAVHVEGDVVVGAEDMARAAAISVFDVGQYALQRKEAEGAAIHLANTAEVTQMQAAARCLDDVGLAEVHVKALEPGACPGRECGCV